MKLYGIALSDYTNMVRTALSEKGLDYEFVIEFPNQEDSYLARSPMGKVPCRFHIRHIIQQVHGLKRSVTVLSPHDTDLASLGIED